MSTRFLVALGVAILVAAGCGDEGTGPLGPDSGVSTPDASTQVDAATCPAPGQVHVFAAMSGKTWTCTSGTDSWECTWSHALASDGVCVAGCTSPAGITPATCLAESLVLSADGKQVTCSAIGGGEVRCKRT